MGIISLLTVHLQKGSHTVHQSPSDVDLLTVLTAIDEAKKGVEACVIGDDTDLVVLSNVHTPTEKKLKMVVPKTGNQQENMHTITFSQALGI